MNVFEEYARKEFNKNRKIIIRNVPPITYDEVKSFMGRFTVANISISKRLRHSIVDLKYGQEAEEAVLELSNKKLLGCLVEVSLFRNDNLLCVSNLPRDMNQEKFKLLVEPYGAIEKCFLKYNKKGEFLQYGLVEYMHNREKSEEARQHLDRKKISDNGFTFCSFVKDHVTTFEQLSSSCLMLFGLPATYTVDCLHKLVQSVDWVMPINCQVGMATHDTREKFGVMEFANEDDAWRIMKKLLGCGGGEAGVVGGGGGDSSDVAGAVGGLGANFGVSFCTPGDKVDDVMRSVTSITNNNNHHHLNQNSKKQVTQQQQHGIMGPSKRCTIHPTILYLLKQNFNVMQEFSSILNDIEYLLKPVEPTTHRTNNNNNKRSHNNNNNNNNNHYYANKKMKSKRLSLDSNTNNNNNNYNINNNNNNNILNNNNNNYNMTSDIDSLHFQLALLSIMLSVKQTPECAQATLGGDFNNTIQQSQQFIQQILASVYPHHQFVYPSPPTFTLPIIPSHHHHLPPPPLHQHHRHQTNTNINHSLMNTYAPLFNQPINNHPINNQPITLDQQPIPHPIEGLINDVDFYDGCELDLSIVVQMLNQRSTIEHNNGNNSNNNNKNNNNNQHLQLLSMLISNQQQQQQLPILNPNHIHHHQQQQQHQISTTNTTTQHHLMQQDSLNNINSSVSHIGNNNNNFNNNNNDINNINNNNNNINNIFINNNNHNNNQQLVPPATHHLPLTTEQIHQQTMDNLLQVFKPKSTSNLLTTTTTTTLHGVPLEGLDLKKLGSSGSQPVGNDGDVITQITSMNTIISRTNAASDDKKVFPYGVQRSISKTFVSNSDKKKNKMGKAKVAEKILENLQQQQLTSLNTNDENEYPNNNIINNNNMNNNNNNNNCTMMRLDSNLNNTTNNNKINNRNVFSNIDNNNNPGLQSSSKKRSFDMISYCTNNENDDDYDDGRRNFNGDDVINVAFNGFITNNNFATNAIDILGGNIGVNTTNNNNKYDNYNCKTEETVLSKISNVDEIMRTPIHSFSKVICRPKINITNAANRHIHGNIAPLDANSIDSFATPVNNNNVQSSIHHSKFLQSPEPSPEGTYVGQHSQGLGGHYEESIIKKRKKFKQLPTNQIVQNC